MLGKAKFYTVLWLVLTGLLLVVAANAQETTQPEAVGLRADAPTYALHGPHWVGFTTREIDDGNERVLHASIWYPALNPDGLAEEITYQLMGMPAEMGIFGRAIADADPDLANGPYPLVLIVHGSGGFSMHLSHIAGHLASHGFVAMAVEYEESMLVGGDMNLAFISRPEDITRQINYAETGEWADLISTEQVAVVGQSFGGLTALNAGGGRLAFDSYLAWCAEHPEFDPMGLCPMLAEDMGRIAERAGLESVPQGLWPDMSDERVAAIVPIVPAGRFIGPDGAVDIDVPTMILGGTGDQIAIPEPNQYQIYDAMTAPKTLVMLKEANHMFPVFSCDDAPWVGAQGFWFICEDAVWDRNRSLDLTNHFVTAFLKAVIMDDTEAAAALAPDAVDMPGIAYETTMR